MDGNVWREVLNGLLSWMEEHDKLAGWLQFVGAMLAVLIAIWVPWYQQRAAARALKSTKIEHELANIQGVFYLLNDAQIWLKSMTERGDMPRKEFRDRVELEDLLERIRIWESREEDVERVRAMYLARGALLRTQKALDLDFLVDKPVEAAEVALILKNVQRIEADRLLVNKQRFRAHRAAVLNRTPWILKPVALLTWEVLTRRRKAGESVKAAAAHT